jgi:hypothetical protein
MRTFDGYAQRMRTTIRLDDRLLQLAWREAERRGVTLASLVEQGLQLVLRQRSTDHSVCVTGDVISPAVDPKKNGSLFDRITRRD